MPVFSSKLFPSSFSLFAWIPLERLTPRASLITTIIKQKAKMKEDLKKAETLIS